MNSVEIGEAEGALADYARDTPHERLVVTHRGRPVALSTNPDFF